MSKDGMVTLSVCRKPCGVEPKHELTTAGNVFVWTFLLTVFLSGFIASYGSLMAYRRLRRAVRRRFR